jgi:Tfp pilus assembly protein FimV
MAAALLVLAAVAVVLLVGAISTGLAGGGHPSTAVGASSPTSAAAASAAGVAAPRGDLIVQPGDTLWSIAASIAPHTDVRQTVDRLVAANGHQPLAVGEHLRIP